jgi:site-specific recombinase XerC
VGVALSGGAIRDRTVHLGCERTAHAVVLLAVRTLPKAAESCVPIPRFLADDLAAHVAGNGPSEFVIGSPRGTVLRVRLVFDQAASAIGLDGLHPHELRHMAASLAITSGADMKVVQQMLGHKSATMTLTSTGTRSAIGWTRWLTRSTPRRAPLICTRCVPAPPLRFRLGSRIG